MTWFRLESHGRPFLLFLSFCLLSVFSLPVSAGTPPLHPVFDFHEDEGKGNGTVEGAPPEAQDATRCVNGFAGPYPCRNVDLLSFLPRTEMGAANAQGSDIWGWTDPATGKEYALMVFADGASFVDVSDPTKPRWLGYMKTRTFSSANRDVRVYRDWAYVAADSVGAHGMQVFDLKRLRSVATPQTFTADFVYTEVDTVHNIDINVETGFAYLVGSNTCSGGLHMVDLRSDPSRPRFVGCYANSANGAVAYIHDTQCVIYRGPDQRYFGRELCFASNVNALTILDVTDKSAVREVARKGYTGNSYSHQGWLTEDHRYFLMDDEGDELRSHGKTRTYLWDVQDLTDPQQFATHEHATGAIDHDQYIHQGFTYQGNYRAGLRILDVSAVSQGRLTEVGYFDIVPEDDEPRFSGAWGVYPFFRSGIILVPGMEQGLYILRRTDGGKPGEPCKPGAQTLCLAKKRFKVEVDWNNQFDGSSGRGVAVKGSDQAGYFSFGDKSNLELMVKILDDGSHWQLYYGQLTNLRFTVRVTDTKTGLVTTRGNGPNNCGGVAELGASDGHGHRASSAPVWLGADPVTLSRPGEGIAEDAALDSAFEPAKGKGSCKVADGICLLNDRFVARVTWRNQFNGTTGKGKGKALSGVTGSFSFTDASNIELLVKVLNAGGTGDERILVLWGAMSNLEYTLELTDRQTGEVQTYHNPAGTYCGGLDEM